MRVATVALKKGLAAAAVGLLLGLPPAGRLQAEPETTPAAEATPLVAATPATTAAPALVITPPAAETTSPPVGKPAAGTTPMAAATPAATAIPASAAAPAPPVAAATLPSKGPLGESPAQIVRRYGPVRRHNARVRHHQVLEGGSAMDGDLHEKNGIIIRVVYHEGRAVLLEYNRGVGPLSAADVDLFLGNAGDGFEWKLTTPGNNNAARLYDRSDRKAVAHWDTSADGSLLIASEDANDFSDKLLP